MADRSITELTEATTITQSDNFVLEQANSAKRLTGQTLKQYLLSWIDGHGGILSVTKTATSGLVDTYTITYAGDDTTTTFPVTNGKGISSISKTSTSALDDTYTINYNDSTSSTYVVTNGNGIDSITKTGTLGLVDTYTIEYTDGDTSTYEVTNGEKGDKGDSVYMWVRYSIEEPEKNADMLTEINNWIGIYVGDSETAPVDYTDYEWFMIKGETGEKGDSVTIVSTEVKYLAYPTGSGDPPSDGQDWQSTVPTVPVTQYLWTRTRTTYSDLTVSTFYTSVRQPRDGGGGTVNSVNGYLPNLDGEVELPVDTTPTDLSNNFITSGAVFTGVQSAITLDFPISATNNTTLSITDTRLTANHRVYQNCIAHLADIAWDTYDGGATLSCSKGFPAMVVSFYLPH